ncbi:MULTISPECIES: nucleotidyltransferase family protein [Methylobacterium]|uniref:nucleotidyltransferase family protein n=1 Tax=Methylobacterium TaxID=407 RepID=UPI0013EDF1E2|nr:nucleotidyltransferase domain-containing protein [Methylobacterium sp. DB0501]NGM35218.1 DNA polymerase III subunit beta [Methylobacterium sp. DB0501]
MTQGDAISHLKAHADSVRAMGATALYLFGSTARNEARPVSDLDLFIDDDPESRFNGFDLVGIKLFLEDQLEKAVDVTTRDSLHPRLRERIERSAVRVF